MNSPAELDKAVTRDFKHNFIVNALDGVCFWFGYSFITPSTILPVFVSHFTSSNFLIGLIPTLSSGAYLMPQLFTSNWVRRLPSKKIVPVNYGFFLERVPILLLPLATLFFTKSAPGLALALFFILFTWHTVGAGIISVGWQDMVAKVIPMERRGSFFGLTNFGGTITGVLGASGVAWVLAHYAFPTGYVWSFTAAAVLIFLSWVFLAMVRETPVISQAEDQSQLQFFRSLPGILRKDRNFSIFLACQVVIALSSMGIGFLTVYAVSRWSLPDSQAGTYTATILVGQALANLLLGPLADRKGHKLVLGISALLAATSFLLASLAPQPWWFFLVFALRGASNAGSMLSGMVITFEFTSPEMRPTYIGLSSTIYGLAATLAPLVGSVIANQSGYRWLFGVSAAIGLAGWLLLTVRVKEPRFYNQLVTESVEAEQV